MEGRMLLDAALKRHESAPLWTRAGPRVHLVGIAGAGMRSLADVLEAAGWQVSGSDLCDEPLARPAFEVWQGHDAERIDAGIELVVYSDAVPKTNLELARARQLGVRTLSYAQMLGELMQSRSGVAVAGTHGKSTTTAMAAEIVTGAGFDPTVVVGGAAIGGHSGGRHGRSRWMLVEACEYRANFRHMRPEMAAILNIEPDHFDCFPSTTDLEEAFAAFARQVPREGLVLARAECAATRRAVAGLDCTRELFGLTSGATWQATALRQRRGYYSFQIRCRGRLLCDVKLAVAGLHNVLNALAAAALASHCGATALDIRAGLERFAGLKRRLQLLGEVREIALVDDYAHHPTEVAATLTTLRQMYPGRRLWCVFQPHQASRLARLLDDLAHSLQNADKFVVADIYRAREDGPEGGVTARDLCAAAARLGGEGVYLAKAAEIHDHLKNALRAGDVLVTMGAGDIGTVAHELGKRLRTFRKTG